MPLQIVLPELSLMATVLPAEIEMPLPAFPPMPGCQPEPPPMPGAIAVASVSVVVSSTEKPMPPKPGMPPPIPEPPKTI